MQFGEKEMEKAGRSIIEDILEGKIKNRKDLEKAKFRCVPGTPAGPCFPASRKYFQLAGQMDRESSRIFT